MNAAALGGMFLQLLLDEGLHVAGDFLVEEGLADALDDLAVVVGADVGQVEPLFQLGEEILIDPAAQPEQRGDAGETSRVRARPALILSKMARKTIGYLFLLCSKPFQFLGRNGTAPTPRRPGPWQSLPPLTANPRPDAHARSS